MLENINSKDSGQMIIGVDSNQSLAFPSNKTKFFSSVEKKIAVGVYKAMILLAGIPLDFTSGNTNDQGFEGDFKANGKSALVKYGFDKGMIGYSPSTLAGEEAAKVNALLENAYKIFLTLKPIEPSKDYFKPMTDSSKNQVILDAMIAQINK
jgi:basic membrane lipoprotein Med (substrate-binding protein (PBP1-ABC) superfamily)